MTYMQRSGQLDDDSYGCIDDLEMEYDGNQLTQVYDNESDNTPTYEGAMQSQTTPTRLQSMNTTRTEVSICHRKHFSIE